ncbi:hypothetical protein CPB84DRAFT_1785524 [Gymnopilus junonius]|uniref:DUF6533 domain-containing protein n=1 Tax=Gymnopilus junonius TaxID=109634 RepID=A0A9P5NJM9_GYMJU|nr:hypothetical protein CPB84DRAFT_1785524 [Gymnopilus junonius]
MWVSGLTFLVCDTISTLPREVEYIWSKKWSVVKVLYLFMRYWTICQGAVASYEFSTVQKSLEVCRALVWFEVSIGGGTVLLVAIDIILSIRLHALYKRSRKVLVFLSALVIGEFVIQAYVVYKIGLSAVGSIFIAPLGFPILGCLTSPDLAITLPSWISTPLIAVIFFIMMLIKFYESMKLARSSGVRLSLTPVISAFIRDGTIYFLLVVVTLLAGALDSFLTSGAYLTLYQPWSAVSFAVTGTRLILNLREAASPDNAALARGDLGDLGTLRFAENRGLETDETM